MKNVLKKILPRAIYNFLRNRPKLVLLNSHLYQKISKINNTSLHEDPDDRGDTLGILRKQAHIIDKGLQTNNRKPGHSASLAIALEKNLNSTNKVQSSSETAIWAKEILNLHTRLQSSDLTSEEYKNFPYIFNNKIPFENLFSAIQERRSIRHFKDTVPDINTIKKALLGCIWAPSSCNRQTIVTYLATTTALAKECSTLNKGATSISGSYLFISVCFDSRSYHLPHESLTGYIDASLGFQNSLLLFHSLGLGACVLNWSHANKTEESSLRRALKIPSHCEIAFNVIVGLPEQGAPTPGKKSLAEYIVERK